MDSTNNDGGTLARALEALAVGRIVLGVAALAAPTRLARSFGVAPSAEVGYLSRIYGARAIALGASYLMAEGNDRDRLQLLSLGVDISDTVTGTGHLRRGDTSRSAMTKLVALTGGYATIGAARAVQRLAGR